MSTPIKYMYLSSEELSKLDLTPEQLTTIKVNPLLGYNYSKQEEIASPIEIDGKKYLAIGQTIGVMGSKSPLKNHLQNGNILYAIKNCWLSIENNKTIYINQAKGVIYRSLSEFITDGDTVEIKFLVRNSPTSNTQNRGESDSRSVSTKVKMNFLYSINDQALINKIEKDIIINLPTRIKEKLFNQDQAVDEIFNDIKVFSTGLKESDKPIGSYLLTGPTGTGKTEIAKMFAEHLSCPFVRIDMSEFSERHTVSRLVGAPAGYIGYGEPTILEKEITNDKRKLVLLLDEMEKSHPDLQKIFLQAFDNAKITLANGAEIDFSNVLILMTANLGIVTKTSLGLSKNKDKLFSVDMGVIEKYFLPEFLGRLSGIITFNPLEEKHALIILEKFVQEFNEKKLKEKGASVILSPAAKDFLILKGFDQKYGARPLKRILNKELYHKIADLYLYKDESEATSSIFVDYVKNEIVVSFMSDFIPDLPLDIEDMKPKRKPISRKTI